MADDPTPAPQRKRAEPSAPPPPDRRQRPRKTGPGMPVFLPPSEGDPAPPPRVPGARRPPPVFGAGESEDTDTGRAGTQRRSPAEAPKPATPPAFAAPDAEPPPARKASTRKVPPAPAQQRLPLDDPTAAPNPGPAKAAPTREPAKKATPARATGRKAPPATSKKASAKKAPPTAEPATPTKKATAKKTAEPPTPAKAPRKAASAKAAAKKATQAPAPAKAPTNKATPAKSPAKKGAPKKAAPAKVTATKATAEKSPAAPETAPTAPTAPAAPAPTAPAAPAAPTTAAAPAAAPGALSGEILPAQPRRVTPSSSDLAPTAPSLRDFRDRPMQAPELLALAAVARYGPGAATYIGWLREQYPGASGEGIARAAAHRFVRQARNRGAMAGLAGPLAVLLDAGSLHALHADLILHVAAAHGADPTAPERAAELLYLLGVHDSAAAASTAVNSAIEPSGGAAVGDPTRLTRPLARTLTLSVLRVGARRVLRLIPGAGAVIGAIANTRATDEMVTRALRFYRSNRSRGRGVDL